MSQLAAMGKFTIEKKVIRTGFLPEELPEEFPEDCCRC